MITLYQLAEQCEKVLNAQVDKLDGFIDNTSFKFVIHVNEGEFKKASRNTTPITVTEANRVTYHINAIMKALSSDFDGDYKTLKDDGTLRDTDLSSMISASMSTSIEFLIPFPSLTKQVVNDKGETQTVSFYETVMLLITSTLQQGWSAYLTDENEVKYLVGTRFTIPSANMKDIRALAGESMSFVVYGEHFFVNEGVNSNRIKLSVYNPTTKRYEPIFTTRLGIARRSEIEGNLYADDYNEQGKILPVSKNVLFGTSLTISFESLFRTSYFDTILSDYLLYGLQPATNCIFQISISDEENVYSLIFADAGLNGMLGTVASISARLVEVYHV